MFDKEYILTRLQNGESIDAIGEELTKALNDAVAAHKAQEEAKKAEMEAKDKRRRELGYEIIEKIQEYAMLEGLDPEDVAVSEEDLEELLAAFSGMVKTIQMIKGMCDQPLPAISFKTTDKKPAASTDDEILRNFVKIFG